MEFLLYLGRLTRNRKWLAVSTGIWLALALCSALLLLSEPGGFDTAGYIIHILICLNGIVHAFVFAKNVRWSFWLNLASLTVVLVWLLLIEVARFPDVENFIVLCFLALLLVLLLNEERHTRTK